MKWILRISNTHRELSVKELENLLSKNDLRWINPLLLLVETDKEQIDRLTSLSASIKWVMQNPIVINDISDVETELNQLSFLSHLPLETTNTFAARLSQLLTKNNTISKKRIERLVGGKILQNLPELSVDLDTPDQEFRVVVSGNILCLGWIYRFCDFDKIASRSPKESPFFGGGAMKPMMSQLMVNLVKTTTHQVLDPFCGHGGFLREISAKGMYALGIEVSWKIIRENRINNKYHGTSNIAIIAGDALRSPFRKGAIEAVVTDPPYAKQSTTVGRDREELVDMWLERQTVDTIIMSLPEDMKINIPMCYTEDFAVKDYVHRSLTRVIRKLKLIE